MRENSLHERNASYNRADGIVQKVWARPRPSSLPSRRVAYTVACIVACFDVCIVLSTHERTRTNFLRRGTRALAPHAPCHGNNRSAAHTPASLFLCHHRG